MVSAQLQASRWAREVLVQDEVVTMLIKNITASLLNLEGLGADELSV